MHANLLNLQSGIVTHRGYHRNIICIVTDVRVVASFGRIVIGVLGLMKLINVRFAVNINGNNIGGKKKLV
jgi:hypothetical protein